MIKLTDILNENLDIEGLFNKLITKIKQSGQSTAGLEREFGAANDPVAKLKVLNKYKNIVSESHSANEQWSESFYETIEKMDMTDAARNYINQELNKINPIEQYGGPDPINAAKQFVKDAVEKFKEQAKSSALNEESIFKIDPTLASKIYDILEKEGISTGMTKSYFTFFLNDRL